jgi:hypothetical protein
MYLVFDWGNCTEINNVLYEQALPETPDPAELCRSSALQKGITGTLAEIIPGLSEAIFFELLLAIFTATATLISKMQNWRTEEQYNAAFAKQIFSMEFFGVFCWYGRAHSANPHARALTLRAGTSCWPSCSSQPCRWTPKKSTCA